MSVCVCDGERGSVCKHKHNHLLAVVIVHCGHLFPLCVLAYFIVEFWLVFLNNSLCTTKHTSHKSRRALATLHNKDEREGEALLLHGLCRSRGHGLCPAATQVSVFAGTHTGSSPPFTACIHQCKHTHNTAHHYRVTLTLTPTTPLHTHTTQAGAGQPALRQAHRGDHALPAHHAAPPGRCCPDRRRACRGLQAAGGQACW